MSRRRAAFYMVCLIVFISLAVYVLIWRSGFTTNLAKILPASQAIPIGFYAVNEVYDGDTFAVDMNGRTEKIRLIGVDTPETHKPGAPVQCFGPEASDFTART